MKIFNRFTLGITAISATFALSSCESPVGQGAAYGAGGGAIVGGIVGNDVRSAAVGAGIGAATGALVGALVQENQRANTTNTPYRAETDYPYGRKSNQKGYVYSPYRPYNLIDVRGYPSGAVVIDPSTNGRFVNP